jgi:2-hydroxychromene-2-carboxylate isomerase
MGDLLSLAEHRARRERSGACGTRHARSTFFFDLADPGTYLAAERVERLFPGVRWTPAWLPFERWPADAEMEARAAALGMPLEWPDRYPAPRRIAMRAALHACHAGRGATFVLAASRLAFCGGFDLDDPEVLAEAAAAAALELGACLNAAGDDRLDARIAAAGRTVVGVGVDTLPALQVGSQMFGGEERIAEAAAARRAAMAPAVRQRSGPAGSPMRTVRPLSQRG